MAKTKVTRTTNPLPFHDLHDRRFEDLVTGLVYRLRNWVEFQPFGRSGSDEGKDIWAVERLVDGTEREWVIQCRRYQRAAKAELTKAVDDVLDKSETIPHVVLVAVACNVSKRAHKAYTEYALSKGIEAPQLWMAATIEAKLYSDRPDLLLTYFDISILKEERRKETMVKKDISMKRRLQKVFPYDQEYTPEIIVHSIDDDEYPQAGAAPEGRISSWFKVEFCGHYHNGIEVYLAVHKAVIDEKGNWAIVDDYNATVNETIYRSQNVFGIGRIPYRNIVEIDDLGDEYYGNAPHLYCKFADHDMPYEEIIYRPTGEGYQPTLNSERRFEFKARRIE